MIACISAATERVDPRRAGDVPAAIFCGGVSAGAALAAGTLSFRELLAVEAPTTCAAAAWPASCSGCKAARASSRPSAPSRAIANGGETKAIATAVPGIQISENFPKLGAQMKHVAIVRSMTSKEGSHPRATYLLHTGYLPTASVKYPALGSIVASELGHGQLELPAFVRIGNVQNASGGGLLGSEFDPFVMPAAGKLPANTTLAHRARTASSAGSICSAGWRATTPQQSPQEVADHQKLYRKAARMIQSPQMKAFDLEAEPEADSHGVRQRPRSPPAACWPGGWSRRA